MRRRLVVRREGIKLDQEKTLCKDWEVVLKQKKRRGGDTGYGGGGVFHWRGGYQHYFGDPAWPDFEKRILIASVGWR